jgi:hypothetical protein
LASLCGASDEAALTDPSRADRFAAFLKAFNALKPESNFVATKMFAAVGRDRAYVFFESGIDLCTTPSPLHRPGYEKLAKRAHGDGA